MGGEEQQQQQQMEKSMEDEVFVEMNEQLADRHFSDDSLKKVSSSMETLVLESPRVAPLSIRKASPKSPSDIKQPTKQQGVSTPTVVTLAAHKHIVSSNHDKPLGLSMNDFLSVFDLSSLFVENIGI